MRADAGSGGAAAPVKENAAKDAIIPVDNSDSWVVGSDRMDHESGATAKHTRAFFNKVKGAFRAGTVHTDARANYWDDANVGYYSSAFGLGPRATGAASHAQGTSTTASGQSSHAEGDTTVASGVASHAEGSTTTASGGNAHAEGESTVASGNASHAEGNGSTAESSVSHAEGALAHAFRYAQHAKASGQFAAKGDAQIGNMVLRNTTTDATAVVLSAVPALAITLTGGATNVLTLLASRAFTLKISTVARRTNVQGEMAGFTWEGLVGRDSTGNARIIGTPVVNKWNDASAAAYAVAVSINTTDVANNYVAVTVTGEALKTIRWVAKVEWVEVGG